MAQYSIQETPGFQLDYYEPHSGSYRPIRDLSAPWVASPSISSRRDLSDPPQSNAKSENTLIVHYVWKYPPPPDSVAKRKAHLHDMIFRWRTRLRKRSASQPAEKPQEDRVPLTEWKQFGYYAYPNINGGFVRNMSPGPEIQEEFDLNEMVEGLVSPGGRHHPERWIGGTRHQALPARPPRWPRPQKDDPLPFPWECQLNPLLVHQLFGPSPIKWNVGFEKDGMAWFNTPDGLAYPLREPDFAQPATWPFLTHMHIKRVADDPAPGFHWPFMIRNDNGISCGDVLDAIYESLRQFVSEDERQSWTYQRRELADRSCNLRRDLAREREETETFIRRVDYYGFDVHFRGLESNPNRNEAGWILYLGVC